MADMLPAGLAVAAAGSAAFEAAYVLQALEARSAGARRRAAGVLGALARRRRWLAGLALAGLGALLQVVALRLAPLTAVQPVLALGVIGLVVIGSRVLGEPLLRPDVAAALAAAAGVAALGIAAARLDDGAPDATATAAACVALGVPVVVGAALRAAPPALLLAGAGAGDALAAVAAKRLADATTHPDRLAAIGWLALAGGAVAGALACEMAVLQHWPATRVGPVVLACQTAVPVLLAPLVAGERWGARAPAVLAGLALTTAGCARLGASAARLERREALQQHVGGGREPVP